MALLNLRRCVTRLILLMAVGHAAVQAQSVNEYQVKAAFLYNFAKFVEWPAGSFKNPADPIVICILGRSPLGPSLEQAVTGKQIEGHSLVIRQTQDPQEAAGCHLLFIAASEKKRFSTVFELLKSAPILTVGESTNFAAAGGVVNFKMDDGRVGLEINVCAAERARLRISSKLLSLAKIIKDDKP
jgi:hypothetical protein